MSLLRKRKIFSLIILSLSLIFLGGCSFGFGSNKGNLPDAGVYKSVDYGKHWRQIAAVPTISGHPASIGRVGVLCMTLDPEDHNTIYLGTERNGIYYTYDGGQEWQHFDSFPKGKVYDIKVDPSSKCILYATYKNLVKKSTDCGRSWQTIFVEDNPQIEMTALAIDNYNTNILYAGTSHGVVYKSFDAGHSWSTPFKKVDSYIKKILVNPLDTRIIYVATRSNGLFKTTDAGKTWKDLNKNLSKYPGYNQYIDLFFNPSRKNSLFLISRYGLLKTEDGGLTWEPIPLLTAPGRADIRAGAVDPKNDNYLYYATKTTFYRTVNGGKDWVATKLFSTKPPTAMLVDPQQTNVIYTSFSYPIKK